MSRKFSITISDRAHADLARLASRKRGGTIAGLAAFFVEREIASARERGDLPDEDDENRAIALSKLNDFLDALENGKRYTDKQIEALAVLCDRPIAQLRRIQNCYPAIESSSTKKRL